MSSQSASFDEMEVRVRQELFAGELSDQDELFEVVSAHLDKDIQEDGMTATVDKNGCVQIIQLIRKEGSEVNGDATEVASTQADTQIVCTSLLLMDEEGNIETNADYIYNTMQSENSGGNSTYQVYATHTAYFSTRTPNGLYTNLEVKLTSMKTVLTYGTAIQAGELTRKYEARRDKVSAAVTDSKTRNNPSAGTYTFTPSGCQWYNATSGTPGGYIAAYAIVKVGTSTFIVEAGVDLTDGSVLI